MAKTAKEIVEFMVERAAELRDALEEIQEFCITSGSSDYVSLEPVRAPSYLVGGADMEESKLADEALSLIRKISTGAGLPRARAYVMVELVGERLHIACALEDRLEEGGYHLAVVTL